MRVLLTNDDGIDADGLRRLRQELLKVPGIELLVIAPDRNRSAIARGITFHGPVRVERRSFEDGLYGWSTDGTPVDCVRLADLGLDARDHERQIDLVVAGINHGANLGDDITYSGTVAAALEGVVLGLPAIAVSLEITSERPLAGDDPFGRAARFVARLVERLDDVPLPEATMLNVNVPAAPGDGVEVARLGRRVYYDSLMPEGDPEPDGSGSYTLYNREPGHADEPGTDLHVIAGGRIAVTPLHLDLTLHDGIGPLTEADLQRMLEPAEDEA